MQPAPPTRSENAASFSDENRREGRLDAHRRNHPRRATQLPDGTPARQQQTVSPIKAKPTPAASFRAHERFFILSVDAAAPRAGAGQTLPFFLAAFGAIEQMPIHGADISFGRRHHNVNIRSFRRHQPCEAHLNGRLAQRVFAVRHRLHAEGNQFRECRFA